MVKAIALITILNIIIVVEGVALQGDSLRRFLKRNTIVAKQPYNNFFSQTEEGNFLIKVNGNPVI